MDIIRKELTTNELFPANLREHDGVIQYTPDGGATWIDSPESDPRLHNAYPPSGSICNSVARMVAFMQDFEGQLETALQGAAAAAELGTLILLILAFIPFIGILTAVIVGLAAQFVVVGYAAMHNAFLGFDWSGLKCALYCIVDDGGSLDAGRLTQFKAYITANYDATVETVLNGLLDIAGYAGMNAVAAVRTDVGDCDECSGCNWTIDITPDSAISLDWSAADIYSCSNVLNYQGARGSVQTVGGVHVFGSTALYGTNGTQPLVTFVLPVGATITGLEASFGNSASLLTLSYQGQRLYCLANPTSPPRGLPSGLNLQGSGAPVTILATANRNSTATAPYIDYIRIIGNGVRPVL